MIPQSQSFDQTELLKMRLSFRIQHLPRASLEVAHPYLTALNNVRWILNAKEDQTVVKYSWSFQYTEEEVNAQ